MRYLELLLLALTAVTALGWYALWVFGGQPRLQKRMAVLPIVAFVATVVAHQIKVTFPSTGDSGIITGRP
jgi:hypothetical protein